jgi:hypothetical protein
MSKGKTFNICLKKNQLCQLMSDNDVGGERKRG